jgi:hypothetical protein
MFQAWKYHAFPLSLLAMKFFKKEKRRVLIRVGR